MKRVLLLILLLSTLVSQGQIYQKISTWEEYLNRFRITGMLRPPLAPISNADTGSFYYRPSDSTYLGWSGNGYRPIGGGADHGIATGSRTATGNYVQDWNNKNLSFINTKTVNLHSYRSDPNHPGNKKLFRLYSDSTVDGEPLAISWGLKNVDENFQDSIGFSLSSTENYTYLYHFGQGAGRGTSLSLNGNVINPSIQFNVDGNSKNSYFEFGRYTIIQPADSMQIYLPSKTSLPKVMGLLDIGGGSYTPYAIDNTGGGGGSISSTATAYVDSTYGNDGTAQVDRADKKFKTLNAALDATASFGKRIIEIGVGTYASPDTAKIKSFTWFKGSGKPKPNWTVAVPSVDGDTKTDPTHLIGGTILQGSFWFHTTRLQNIIVTDLGVDVGSAWCTASNGGNPAEGLVFTTDYAPGSGNASDGGHFLQLSVTPLQGLVVHDVAIICQSSTAAVHAALFENCFSPDISGVSTYFGLHGIVFKTIGGTASNLQAFGHDGEGIIIKSNDYANCYRLTLSNFTIGSIGTYDGGGLQLDAGDGGSPGLYFCNISNGTINRTKYGIKTRGNAIDNITISSVQVNVTQGYGVSIPEGFAYSALQTVKVRSCLNDGFNIATAYPGIEISDCSSHDNVGNGFNFSNASHVQADNIIATLNDDYGVNVASGTVHIGVSYYLSNTDGSTNGSIISKLGAGLDLDGVTSNGNATTNDVLLQGYSTTMPKLTVGDMTFQPYGLNNHFIVDNAAFGGAAWARINTGYAGKFQFYNGQILLSNANTGSGVPTFITGFKTDFNGHVGLGGNIDDVTYSGSKVFVNGSTGEVRVEDSLRINNTPTGNTSDSVLVKRNNVVYAVAQNTIGALGYSVYTALITQSGTSDPTTTVLGINTVGSIVWTRSGAGIYVGTLTGAFTTNKTWMTIDNTDETSTITHARIVRTGANTVLVTTYNGAFAPTDVFTNISMEIRVYP